MTGKPHLGLEAAREIGMGELGVLMYAATSARSIRDALGVAMRFTRLLLDGTTATLHVTSDRAIIRFTCDYALPAASVGGTTTPCEVQAGAACSMTGGAGGVGGAAGDVSSPVAGVGAQRRHQPHRRDQYVLMM